MVNKNKSLFTEIKPTEKPLEKAYPEQKGAFSPLDRITARENRISKLASGDIKSVQMKLIDPSDCKVREFHNRIYSLLNEKRCESLIQSLIAQGKQEIPAIVRKTDDPDYEYEIICGARRHFAISWLRENNYPNFKYLIETRALTDEEAFRLSDLENRENVDLSNYERAMEYKHSLGAFYKNQADMAKRMEKSKAWLSDYLFLANLPEDVLKAYPNVLDIKIREVRTFRTLVKNTIKCEKLIKRATEVQLINERRAEEGKTILESKKITSLLKQDPDSLSVKEKIKVKANTFKAKAANGAGVLTMTVKKIGSYSIDMQIRKDDKKALLSAFNELLEKTIHGR